MRSAGKASRGAHPVKPVVRRLAQAALTAALTLAVVALSRVPWQAEPSNDAVLRLAWRYRSPLADHCRRLSEEEVEHRPAHMRRAEECERRLRPYRLEIELEGRTVVDDSVPARGARGDRPLSVFRELALEPGRYRLQVEFAPYALPGGAAAPRFELDTLVSLGRRQVLLLTMDEGASRLEARSH